MSIFALYNVNKHSMLRQKREKNGTGICHVMQGKESKTCPYDSGNTKIDVIVNYGNNQNHSTNGGTKKYENN